MTNTLKFDEAYCHSAGIKNPKVYEIDKEVSEIIFDFGNMQDFINTYVVNHPYLPWRVKRKIKKGNCQLVAQVIQNDSVYIYYPDKMKNKFTFNSQTMEFIKGKNKDFTTFSEGLIFFGLLELKNIENFNVLWATAYKVK